MNILDYITAALMIIGALNWMLVGVFYFNLVEILTSSLPGLRVVIYALVGASGAYWIWRIYTLAKK
jgi:uncharacterized protein